MTRYACKTFSGGGRWVYGKKWIKTDKTSLQITSQKDCESLTLCKVNGSLVNGTCDSNNCIGNTYECKNRKKKKKKLNFIVLYYF